jgi:hypothetical protein
MTSENGKDRRLEVALRRFEKAMGVRLSPQRRAAIEAILRDVDANTDPAEFQQQLQEKFANSLRSGDGSPANLARRRWIRTNAANGIAPAFRSSLPGVPSGQ